MYRIGDGLEAGMISWQDRIDVGDQCKVIKISRKELEKPCLEGRDRRLSIRASEIFQSFAESQLR